MAEELRELRVTKQIPAKDMVAVVQTLYPKYDKTVQSKCENGEAYGVTIRPDAMHALYERFGFRPGELVEEFGYPLQVLIREQNLRCARDSLQGGL